MDTIRPEHPSPAHFLVHLSDTHLVGGDIPVAGTLDSEARLRKVIDTLEATGARPEALVFTGDLANNGEAMAYERLREMIEPAALRMGAQVIWAMGNHDDRENFREGLLDEAPSTEPVDRTYWVGGLRIITVDTTVPGLHHGAFTEAQLAWLGHQLETPAPDGTILAMHHPPVPSVQALAVLVELRGQAALADVVRGTDVRAILAGHLHYSTFSSFAGIPVSVASATCYTQDLATEVDASTGIRTTRGRDGAQAYNLVHVYPEAIVHSVVPAAGGDSVGEVFDPAQVAENLAARGVVYDGGPAARRRSAAVAGARHDPAATPDGAAGHSAPGGLSAPLTR